MAQTRPRQKHVCWREPLLPAQEVNVYVCFVKFLSTIGIRLACSFTLHVHDSWDVFCRSTLCAVELSL